ncbi:MAG: hypothetical protein ABIT38_02825 [Gemmatimonadaceae bacterium]
MTSAVHANAPYSSKGTRNVLNTNDGIYNSLSSTEKTALTVQATASGTGYTRAITLGVSIA